MEKSDGIRKHGLAASLKPDFILKTTEYFADEDEVWTVLQLDPLKGLF